MTNRDLNMALKKITDNFAMRLSRYNSKVDNLKKTNKKYNDIVNQYKQLIIESVNFEQNNDIKIIKLEKEIDKLESENNIVRPLPACKLCGDTGKIGFNLCACVKKVINENNVKKSGINQLSIKHLSDCDLKKVKQDFKDNIEKMYKFFGQQIDDFNETKYQNYLVCGDPGVGKTFLFSCIAGELLNKNISVLFASAFSLNNLFLKYHTTFTDDKATILEPVFSCDALFIDDLGTEQILKNVTSEYLLEVLKDRVMSGKKTYINTNLSMDTLLDKYGERIFSRITDKSNSIALVFENDNMRMS